MISPGLTPASTTKILNKSSIPCPFPLMLAKYIKTHKITSMSELESNQNTTVPSELLKEEFARLLDLNERIRNLRDSQAEIHSSIKRKIMVNGVEPEDRFLATALFSDMMKTHTTEGIYKSMEAVKALDRELRSHPGETITWLDTVIETIAHRTPGPDEERTVYYLNLGILGDDSQLSSYRDGYAIKPVRSARIQMYNILDNTLAWDMGVGKEGRHDLMGEPEITPPQAISVTPEGKFETIGITHAMEINTIELPAPLIGNDAVAEFLTNSGLENDPRLQKTVELLARTPA
jgi:hypothetical protein